MNPKPILWLVLLTGILSCGHELRPPVIAKPGCKDICGNVSIPFPWGIGANCFLDPWFEIKCNASSNGSVDLPILSKFNIEVVEIAIIFAHTIRVRVPVMKVCTEDTQLHRLSSLDLRGSPYGFSTSRNILVMKGCGGRAVMLNQTGNFMAECSTICRSNKTNNCYGFECCRAVLYDGSIFYDDGSIFYDDDEDYDFPLQFYQIDLLGQPSDKHQNCIAITLIDLYQMDDYEEKLSTTDPPLVPIVLSWRLAASVRSDFNNPNTVCNHYHQTDFIYCLCDDNSDGLNPYVTDGCQVIGNSFFTALTSVTAKLVYTLIGIAIGPLVLVFSCRWLLYCTKRRKRAKKRVKFFKLMLQRHQSFNNGVVESTKLFTHKELDKATDHFNNNRVLGKGGQGTVYKGMLTDGTIVAIKKSVLMDETQMEQFINEVVVLSLINHRNVVKLLGCCLETEVPLLAYEFVSNGTLYQQIHHPAEDFVLSWDMRLKIAADSAGAIAYLHSSSSTPIYHRDIKSSNILLDDKHRAKVSDFGSSKTIEIDQTHATTLVQGTMGYLDPEYFESNVFTEKSDVYSFGVVLLELLTGKKPIYRTETMQQKSLVTEFFIKMQNSSLSDILDSQVLKEAKEEQLVAFADLAKRCLNGSGRFRPTMKDVAMTLEMIIKFPDETSTLDLQTFGNEIVMSETSDAEFISTSFPAGAPSPLYIDVHPLLHHTV